MLVKAWSRDVATTPRDRLLVIECVPSLKDTRAPNRTVVPQPAIGYGITGAEMLFAADVR